MLFRGTGHYRACSMPDLDGTCHHLVIGPEGKVVMDEPRTHDDAVRAASDLNRKRLMQQAVDVERTGEPMTQEESDAWVRAWDANTGDAA